MEFKEIKGVIPNLKSKLPGLILGSELAGRLHVDIGSEVKVISPLAKASGIAGTSHGETYQVVGLYTSGHYDFDQQFLFILISDAQELLHWKNVISGWHLRGKTPDEALTLKDTIKSQIPSDWKLEGWDVFNSALFNSLKLEQYAMFSILSFAVAIAVLNIVITLMMHVSHKRKNIGILCALGASRSQIRKIFVRQGILLGGVGLVIAAVLTVCSIGALRLFPFLQLPAIYYDRSIPVEIRPIAFIVIYGVSVLMIFLATIFPAMKAASTDPIAAIRE
jgi:lipoprotein-releasing system permease protein